MEYEGDIFWRYISCYEKIALDDLENPLEKRKEYRHNELVKFIGDVHNLRILDVGSSQGLFLKKINAKFKIAFDISFHYLKEVDKTFMMPILGKAESIPFKNNSLDIIVCSDVLEHVLYPERVIAEFQRILKNKGKLYVVVPWKENLSSYEIYKGKYEFTHLRSFDKNYIYTLLYNLKIIRMKGIIPKKILFPLIFGKRIPKINKWLNRIFSESFRLKYFPGPVHMMIEVEKDDQ